MFYDNNRMALIVKGVFPVDYSPATVHEKGRSYSTLSFRIKGNSTFLCKGNAYNFDSDLVAYIPKGLDYTRRTEGEESLIVIRFETFGEDETELQLIENSADLKPLFETVYKNWCDNEYNKCLRSVYKLFDEIKKSRSASGSEIPKTILKGVEYIENNFRSPELTIGSAAKVCHISETYFRRLYSAHFCQSPVKALIDLRFNYAKSLLESGYYNVKQVALLSGFSDAKYFRTSFKNRFGITPNEYASLYSDK